MYHYSVNFYGKIEQLFALPTLVRVTSHAYGSCSSLAGPTTACTVTKHCFSQVGLPAGPGFIMKSSNVIRYRIPIQ